MRVKGNRLLSSGVVLGLLFVVLGFSDGWASAVRKCLALSYWLALTCLVMSAAFAASLRELGTDRSLWILSVLAVPLGFALYLSLGARSLYYGSLLGIGCGAILGLGLRFGMSNTARRIERGERRAFRRLLKRIGFRGP